MGKSKLLNFASSGNAFFSIAFLVVLAGVLLTAGNMIWPSNVPSVAQILGLGGGSGQTFALAGGNNPGPAPVPSTVGPSSSNGSSTVTCTSVPSQTLATLATDADKLTAVSPLTSQFYFANPATGALAPSGATTSVGQSITALATASGYFSGEGATVTGCTAAPSVAMSLKGVDATSATVYNSFLGGTVNTAAANLTLANGSSATAIVGLQQVAIYKHLSGPTNQFVVYLNASTASNWNPSTMSVSFKGAACAPLGTVANVQSQQPSAIGGSVIYAAVCTGDFNAIDGGTVNQLGIVLSASPGVTVSHQFVGVNYVGIDRYVNSQNNQVQLGGVSDTGAAIQSLKSTGVWVN